MLYHLFQSARTEADFDDLLRLTFSDHERSRITERWKIFDALDQGLSQREVAKAVPCSIATVTRGAKSYQRNKAIIQLFLAAWRAT